MVLLTIFLSGKVIFSMIRKVGATLGADELIAWSRETMAAYKYPRTVEFVDALPMTATGKVLKRELRVAPVAGSPKGPS